MTQSRISYNVHGDAQNFSLPLLWAHLDELNPKWLLIMNATSAAISTARRYPQTNVIIRYGPQDDKPLESWGTAESFVSFVIQDIKGAGYTLETLPPNIWIYTNNESGDSDALHNYLSALLRQPQFKFVVGNYSVGTPQISRWKQLAPFLRLLDEQRHRAVLGGHEYFCVVPPSGVVGGSPVDTQYHPDYTKRENWPDAATMKGLTKWHCGRFEFLIAACTELGIKPPRILITEAGADDLSDIKSWSETLPKTHPYTSIRGWRTLWNAWRSFYGADVNVDKFYADCLIYLDKTVYKNSVVEGQLIFSWAAKEQWVQFDISGTDVPHHLLEYARAQSPTPPPPVEPPPIPVPVPDPPAQTVTYGHRIHITGTDPENVKALDTYLRLIAQAAQEIIRPSMDGVSKVEITGE